MTDTKQKNDKKTDDQPILNNKKICNILKIYTIILTVCFITFSVASEKAVRDETIRDVPLQLIYGHNFLLIFYVGHNYATKKKRYGEKRKGQYFVYSTWIIFSCIFLLYIYNWFNIVNQLPEYLGRYILFITIILACSKYMQGKAIRAFISEVNGTLNGDQ